MDLFAPQPELITLRPYQQQAIDAVYRYLREHADNPCIVLPTAAGKTPVLGTICRDAVNLWGGRVLVLAHVKELLEQAVEKLQRISPDLSIGVYSAGLGRRDTSSRVLVAGIQSVYQRAEQLGPFDLVIVDEAHMIPPDGDGMYQTFLTASRRLCPHQRVIGLTATPFRLKSGPICTHDGILNAVCFEVTVKELIRDGYLSPLVSKAGRARADLSQVHVRGGEFVAEELEAAFDTKDLVAAACREIVQLTQDRKAVLIFTAGVDHAKHVVATLKAGHGINAGLVSGDTPDLYRAQMLGDFREGRLKYLVNINVLTTGFDAPNVDCVALLRSTMSPGLYYQMVGRGFRLHPGKRNCLVLDFGGNVMRHGPVDQIRITDTPTPGTGQAPAKECPQCGALIATGYATCPACGHVFPPPERNTHEATAAEDGVLSGQVTDTDYAVLATHYSVHLKRGADEGTPRSMRVDYEVGIYQHKSEWVCLEHKGYARQKAETWWHQRSGDPIPDSADEAVSLAEAGALAEPTRITVRHVAGEKFERIVAYELPERADSWEGQIPEELLPDPATLPIPEDDLPF